MSALPLKGNAAHKAEIEYHGKFGHTFVRIQHISLMSRIDIFNATCSLATQTLAPTLPGFQGIKRCVKYLAIHPHKTIFNPSNSDDGSNVIRIRRSGNKIGDHTRQNFLECHQY